MNERVEKSLTDDGYRTAWAFRNGSARRLISHLSNSTMYSNHWLEHNSVTLCHAIRESVAVSLDDAIADRFCAILSINYAYAKG
jgi:hypothetical protein